MKRFKARLVVRGNTQVEGIDFNETFSPVVKLGTVRCLIAVALKKNWPLFQLDVNNSFLHGDLNEEVYMKIPPGLSVPSTSSSSAPLRFPSSTVFLVVYMDDIILTGDDLSEISALKSFLDAQFRIKDLGLLHYFLGIEVLHHSSGISLQQKMFIHDLLTEYHCSDVSEVVAPLDISLKLHVNVGDLLPELDKYRSLVGKLNYLTHTRPDLCFTVQHLSQFLQAPIIPHMFGALHVLRYLKGTLDHGVFLNNSSDFSLLASCDSDWVACPTSRRSVSGFCIYLGGNLISWKSKKQLIVSLSSAEAEYRAMSKVVAELAWLVCLLTDLGVPITTHVPLLCDSQDAIHIARKSCLS
ncbi:uncharacterized mitochondrial protein AtMg00810-like [Nicotiana sylvestris]|uniref:uncharacterized mitochondrial protein AtMg00810-like n=1 Tax=Nicotiana sylvestris TaxID=4096 RepID=UPI00388C9B1A